MHELKKKEKDFIKLQVQEFTLVVHCSFLSS
jgi:hypothetical protein